MTSFDLTIQSGSTYTKIFTINQSGSPMNLTNYSASIYIVKSPGILSNTIFSTTSGHIVNGGINGTLTLTLSPTDISKIDGVFYKLEIKDIGGTETEILSGNIFLLDETKSGIEYLTPYVRLRIGDINPLTYQYADEWIKTALIMAIKFLQRWWSNRYYVTDEGIVTRNSTIYFDVSDGSSEIILQRDEGIVVLVAAIIMLQGSLENNAWNVGSWRDQEISFSNIESGKLRNANLIRMWDELNLIMIPPTKKLARAIKGSLPGYAPSGSSGYEHGIRKP